MKTLHTLATAIIAAFLVLGPTVAFAATTITVTTDATSYACTNVSPSVTVSGTVAPTPAQNTNVVITTKNPTGAVVDIGSVPVSTSTGAYVYTYVSGGTAQWISGTYTVNATWGGAGLSASATTTYSYSQCGGSSGGGGGGVSSQVIVWAASPVFAGQSLSTGVYVWANQPGTPTASMLAPGTTSTVSLGTGTRVSGVPYLYAFALNLPAAAADGVYLVTASVTNSSTSFAASNTGSFTVNSKISSVGGSSFTTLVTQITTIQQQQTSLASQISSLQTQVQNVGKNVSNVQSSLSSINLQGVTTALNNIQSSLNTVSSGVTSANNALQGLTAPNGGLSNLAGLSTKLDNVNTAVSNSQTYVLVVAALAAITLVLELAILVRKLS